MSTVIALAGSLDPLAYYVGWSPVWAHIQLTDATGAPGGLVRVTLRNENAGASGQVVFASQTVWPPQDQLSLDLPVDGDWVPFLIAGKFGSPSTDDQDAVIEVVSSNGDMPLSSTRLMVRVRKDVNSLTPGERTRFVAALATLNGAGFGAFTRFRDMHREISSPEAHGLPGFLPWHRAYLLDLERELQRIDSSVTLPYWRFDRPAPGLFAPDFLGASDSSGVVRFSASNPLQFWRTNGQPGIRRRPRFNPLSQPAQVISETATLALGDPGSRYANFNRMEANPHGRAHTSFDGFIRFIDTSARDPLFFLLHVNVDRLWAKWQWFFHRVEASTTAVFPALGSAGAAGSGRVGHNLLDTMWPWNRDTTPPRPPTAPGGTFRAAPFVAAPGPAPRIADMIDYQGTVNPAARLGFDYDDVPFEL